MRSAPAMMALSAAAFLAAAIAGCSGADAGGLVRQPVTTPAAPAATSTATATKASDPDIPDEIVVSWGMQKDFFVEGGFEILEWEDAKALLLERDCRGGKQYHTGWLTIYTNGGRKVLTKQPVIDAFYRFMQESGLPTTGFGTE